MGSILNIGVELGFWIHEPVFPSGIHIPVMGKEGKDLYTYQIGHLANAILMQDYDPQVEIDSFVMSAASSYLFPPGALISGSFVTYHVIKNRSALPIDLQWDDIDIYLRSKEDALKFLSLNNLKSNQYNFTFKNNNMCAYGSGINGEKINLIYGVEFNSPGHLISRFDIRACSMAIDPNANTLYVVRGAIEDAFKKAIVFNPVPRGVTIRRLVKYLKKGFEIDQYQSLFFSELIKSEIHKPDLELLTKKY